MSIARAEQRFTGPLDPIPFTIDADQFTYATKILRAAGIVEVKMGLEDYYISPTGEIFRRFKTNNRLHPVDQPISEEGITVTVLKGAKMFFAEGHSIATVEQDLKSNGSAGITTENKRELANIVVSRCVSQAIRALMKEVLRQRGLGPYVPNAGPGSVTAVVVSGKPFDMLVHLQQNGQFTGGLLYPALGGNRSNVRVPDRALTSTETTIVPLFSTGEENEAARGQNTLMLVRAPEFSSSDALVLRLPNYGKPAKTLLDMGDVLVYPSELRRAALRPVAKIAMAELIEAIASRPQQERLNFKNTAGAKLSAIARVVASKNDNAYSMRMVQAIDNDAAKTGTDWATLAGVVATAVDGRGGNTLANRIAEYNARVAAGTAGQSLALLVGAPNNAVANLVALLGSGSATNFSAQMPSVAAELEHNLTVEQVIDIVDNHTELRFPIPLTLGIPVDAEAWDGVALTNGNHFIVHLAPPTTYMTGISQLGRTSYNASEHFTCELDQENARPLPGLVPAGLNPIEIPRGTGQLRVASALANFVSGTIGTLGTPVREEANKQRARADAGGILTTNTLGNEVLNAGAFGVFSENATKNAAYLLAHAALGMIKINGHRCPILIGELPPAAKTIADLQLFGSNKDLTDRLIDSNMLLSAMPASLNTRAEAGQDHALVNVPMLPTVYVFCSRTARPVMMQTMINLVTRPQ